MSTLNILGYIGDIAFVIVGIAAAKKIGLRPFWQLLSGMSTAFFGGIFLRDLGLLRTSPAIFGSPLELAATAAVGVVAIAVLRNCNGTGVLAKILNALLCAIDSSGVAGFAAFGYGRGMQAGADWQIALACAFVTACGGGVIAAVIRAVAARDWRHLTKTLAGNRFYFLLCAFASAMCGAWYSDGYGDNFLIALAVVVVVGGFIVEIEKSKK